MFDEINRKAKEIESQYKSAEAKAAFAGLVSSMEAMHGPVQDFFKFLRSIGVHDAAISMLSAEMQDAHTRLGISVGLRLEEIERQNDPSRN